MNIKDLVERSANGEICVVESINDMIPEDFIRKNPQTFANLTCEDDVTAAGIFWIYSKEARERSEYNP